MLVTVSCTTGTAVLAVVAKQTGFMCKHVSASPEMVTWSCIARKALSSDHRHRDAQLPTFKQAALAAIGRKHLCLNRVDSSSFRHAVTNLLPKLQSSPRGQSQTTFTVKHPKPRDQQSQTTFKVKHVCLTSVCFGLLTYRQLHKETT